MKRSLVVVAFACLVESCAPHVDGFLVDPLGNAITISEARINLTPLEKLEGTQSEILPVDSSGRFQSVLRVNSGTYYVEALVPGYKPQSLKVSNADCKNLVIKMEPMATIKGQTFRSFNDVKPDQGAGGVNITPPQL